MRPPSRLELLSTLLVTLSLPRLVPAQGEIVLPRIDRPVQLDGRVTDEEWSGISPLPLTVYEPNFREGNDLWLVYNEGSNLDRDGRTPRPPAVDNRAVLVKYTHTFGS